MSGSLVSIIVPVYNVESYIRKCINSIINQTYSNIQIVIVDDGSKDNSGSICDEFAASDERITVVHQENTGISGARNRGIEVSAGEYLMFVDGDDWIDDETCEKAVAAAEEHKTDLVMWSYIREFSHHSLPKYTYGQEEKLFSGDSYKKLFRRLIGPVEEETAKPENLELLSAVWTKLYRRSVVGDLKFISTNEVSSEDLLFNCSCFSKAKSLYYLSECFYHYRKIDVGSFTHNYQPDFYVKRKRMYCAINEIIKKTNAEEYFTEAYNNRIAIDLLGCGLNICRKNNLSRAPKKQKMLEILNDPVCREATERFNYKYMPAHWRLFYRFAKKSKASALVTMCSAIQFLRSKL